MSNTIMSAKNTFTEGLIMDFAPDNTQATCLTSALNATLLTFNGNELSLLNDMGNGRVETAMLPEGYIPVGTCEFGDIIYIVSYNPLTNKSLIGCFPSPERNISSDEISDLGQLLSHKDFLDDIPNGILKTTTVKKVLLSKNVNPGDKYVIYTDLGCLANLTAKDGNVYVRLSVVSIDDSGKITELDTELKEFFIKEGTKEEGQNGKNLPPDIDSYRNLLQSGWNIFTSKVSGKLAILAELIMPESFSCEYYIDKITEEEKYSYKITLEPTFGGDIKASRLWTKVIFGEKSNTSISEITNGIIDINIEKGHEKDTCILEVCPVMPYGIIDSLKLTFTIDFSKIGTGEIELTRWKYFNQENVSTLSYGLNAYLRDRETIDSVVMHFYDANGLVAEYKLKDANINSGIYTENIGLNGNAINAVLSKYETTKDEEGNEEKILIKHKKTDEIFERANDDSNDLKDDDNYYCINKIENGNYILEDGKLKYHLNDAGVLYSNMLYLVKIIITTKRETIKGYSTKDIPLYRWFWTTSMYNEYYHSIDDFNILKFQLSLSADVVYETNNDTYKWETKEINNLEKSIEESNSANILYIENKTSGNINAYIRPGLQNDYGCFKLYHILKEGDKDENGKLVDVDNFRNFDVEVYFGDNTLTNINANQYDYSDRDSGVSNKFIALDESNKSKPDYQVSIPNTLNDSPQNSFNITPIAKYNKYYPEGYEEEKEENKPYYLKTSLRLNEFYYVDLDDKQALPLNLQAVLFNKAYAVEEYSTKITKPVYVPIINDLNDLDLLGITYDNGHLGFKIALALSQCGNDFSATNIYLTNLVFDTPNGDDDDNLITKSVNINTSQDPDFIESVWNKVKNYMPTFFPVYLGGHGTGNGTSTYLLTQGDKNTTIREEWVKKRTGGWYSGDGGQSRLTINGTRVFDIDTNGKLNDVKEGNHITFLGVKYKDGMILINAAMVDSVGTELVNGKTNYTNTFLLRDSALSDSSLYVRNNTNYYNLAYLLYLIFSNTYHKNKRTDDKEINIKNFIRNSQYEVLLKKNIYYYLKCNSKADIAMHNMSFDKYVEQLKPITEISEDYWESIKNNITLEFISYLHQSDLQIDVKSLPMSFLNSEQDAYFLRNGNLIGTYNLGENQFYIYKDGMLEPFLSRGLLYFDETSTKENFKRITSESDLKGCNPTQYRYKTEENIAQDSALVTIIKYLTLYSSKFRMDVGKELGTDRYLLSLKAADEINIAFNNMYAYFDDNNITINGKSIRSLVNISFYPTGYDSNPEGLTVKCTSTLYNGLINFKYMLDPLNTYIRYFLIETNPDIKISDYNNIHFTDTDKWSYYIDHNFDLTRNFMYDNELILNPTTSHKYFGVRDIGPKLGYTGFLQDVILDTNYQIK